MSKKKFKTPLDHKWDFFEEEIDNFLNRKESLQTRVNASWIDFSSEEAVCKVFGVPLPEGIICDIRVYVIDEIRKKNRIGKVKKQANKLGLKYWPALFYPIRKVDPKAFKYAEDQLSKKHNLWGEIIPSEEGQKMAKGGWDSFGHWGVSPDLVEKAWFLSGCKNSQKFRLLIRLVDQANPGKKYEAISWVKKGYSYRETLVLKKARNFLEKRPHLPQPMWFKRTALKALGHLSVISREAVLTGVKAPTLSSAGDYGVIKKFSIEDLNWGELKKAQALPKQTQAAKYLGPKTSWWILLRQAPPEGLEKVHAFGIKPKLYEHLINLATKEEGARLVDIILPAALLAKLFGSKGPFDQYKEKILKNTCEENSLRLHQKDFKNLDSLDKKSIMDYSKEKTQVHELGQFMLPEKGFWSISKWRNFCLKYPKALKYGGHFSKIEEILDGSLPKNFRELRELVAQFSYEGVTEDNLELAKVCSKLSLTQEQFNKYNELYRNKKVAEGVPHIHLTGKEIGLEGEWVFRKLDAYDPTGPLLGLFTDCCQHLDGAGASCAINGWTSIWSAFYVVEYKGNIVAQSWAWRGTKGELVFDSIEAKGDAYEEGIGKLYRKASQKMLGKMGVSNIMVGNCQYGISRNLFTEKVNQPAKAKEYLQYSDAHDQLWVMKGDADE